jgi:hypothetical protein
MPILISRRTFVARTAVFIASASGEARPRLSRHTTPSVRVAVVGMSTAAPATARDMGIALGAEEAMHAAAMFGGAVALVAVADTDFHPAGFSAVIGDADVGRCGAVGRNADDAAIPFVNVACTADALRGASCRRTMFHVAPSDAMLRDVLTIARTSGTAAAWDPSLARFGADTLNRRFTARFGGAMTSEAWTGWLAIKILWESFLRTRSAAGSRLIEHLSAATTQFDGHKGLPLSFRSWDRQLRQPLYVTTDSGVVEPALGGSDSRRTSREVLDQLGTRESDSACHVR